MKDFCENVSFRPTGLFCTLCWNDSACTSFPLPNCYLRVCLSTLIAPVSSFFLTVTTSAFAVSAFSNKSVPTSFAAEMMFLRKIELRVSQYFVKVQQITVHVVDHYLYRTESLLVLKQPSCNVLQKKNACWILL